MTLEEIDAELAQLEAQRARPAQQTMRDAAFANGGRLSVEDIDREIAELQAQLRNQNQPPQAPGLMGEIEGAMSSFNRGIPFSSEITSAAAAIGAGLQGRDMGEAFRNQTQRTQQASRDFRTRRPNVAALAEGTAMAAPIIATGGAAAPEMLAARAPGLLTQAAQAGATGAAYGYAYGAGGQDQAGAPLRDRLQAGDEGAAIGATLGVAAPVVVAGARRVVEPAFRAARNAARRIPTPAPNTLGANGANLRAVPPPTNPPPRGPRIPREAINTVNRLRDRSGQSVDQLEQRFQRIQRNPQGEVLADAFDTPGVHTLRPIAQSPGRSGQRATETARNRIRNASQRITDALNRGLGVRETRAAALNRLEGSYRDLSANEYAPLWGRPMTSQQRAAFEQRVRPWFESSNPEVRRVMRRAMTGAERQFNLDLANGRVAGSIDDHLGRYAHYVKMELGEQARFAAAAPGGASGNRIGSLRQLYRQFGDLLDDGTPNAIIPDYRRITARAGDYFSAREALDTGEQWLRMGAEEVAASRAAMTEFELYHARVGLADAIRHATRGQVVGNRNVANALDDPTLQEAVAAAFDDPAQAAQFLSTVNTQNELARNALAWGGGSPTWANATYGADEAAHGMAEMAGHAATGNVGGAVARGGRMALNAATLGHVERMNNVRGDALLTRIDAGDDARAFTQAVIAELRRLESMARNNARISRAGAAAAGAQQGRHRQ